MRLMKDGGQIMEYNDPAIPVVSRTGRIANFVDGICPYHWHEEFEFYVALRDKAYYTVNGCDFYFGEGEGIFVNARQLHASGAEAGQAGEFYCLCFSPEMLRCGDALFSRYVEPVVQRGPAACVLRLTEPKQARCLEALRAVYALGIEQLPPLTMAVRLLSLWEAFMPVIMPQVSDVPPEDTEELAAQKRMVQFIYENYQRKLTLAEIAAAGNVCRSKCCALFRRYLHQSPVEFLNRHRIAEAEKLLRVDPASITSIALQCGFNSPSYFAESFLRVRGCTPTAYRAQAKENGL